MGNTQGGTNAYVRARICRAQTASLNLEEVWSPREMRKITKLRISNTEVKLVLLYGSEIENDSTDTP